MRELQKQHNGGEESHFYSGAEEDGYGVINVRLDEDKKITAMAIPVRIKPRKRNRNKKNRKTYERKKVFSTYYILINIFMSSFSD